MTRVGRVRSIRGAVFGVLAVVVAAGLTGCGGDAQEKVTGVASQAASAASQAADALDSASDTARRKLNEVKDGVDAKDAVTLGQPATQTDGHPTVPVTARNTTDSTKSFAVQVNFRDPGGNLLDTVVVTVTDVPAGQSKEATARSTRGLSGTVKADVGTALRY
ncbi:FxLYD domain-containing protein [Streptomyces sp. NPDC048606]|uniref:FxLYD domain-containing protein n=1 Tax=Streptomyces sp. NPDC048606 TaxID=3154726 RepID=UPI0034269E1B